MFKLIRLNHQEWADPMISSRINPAILRDLFMADLPVRGILRSKFLIFAYIPNLCDEDE